jgi:hypothetical protein
LVLQESTDMARAVELIEFDLLERPITLDDRS